MRKLYFIGALVLVGVMAGCGQQKKKQFDEGTILNGTYYNEFFGFSITIPDHMTAFSGEELKADVDSTKVRIENSTRGESESSRGSLLLSIIETSRFSNIAITAEDLRGVSVNSSEHYMTEAAKQLDLLNMNYRQREESRASVMLGGHEFIKAAFVIAPDSDRTLFQDIYCTIIDGFAFLLVATYAENDKENIDNVLKTVKFDK